MSPTWLHPSKWICPLQWKKWKGSPLPKVIHNNHLFTSVCPCDIPNPVARDLCIPSMKLHKAKADWTPKKCTAPIYETRFIKISLQVRNGRLTVHIYTHVQEGSSVSSFPGRSPSQPGVLSRVTYHRYNSRATTSALVRQEASALPLLRVPWFCQGNIANNHSHFTWF